MSEEKQYAERDLMGMDVAGNHYCRHISAMTREQLHSKSDIAAELGWRDLQIAELKAHRDALAAENVVLKVSRQGVVNAFDDAMNEFGMARGETAAADYPAPETPATDAYLNSVRAEGVERLANEHQAIVAALNGDCLFSGSESKYADIVAAALYFAAQLRAGEPS